MEQGSPLDAAIEVISKKAAIKDTPTVDEVLTVAEELKRNKTLGTDAIPSKLWQNGHLAWELYRIIKHALTEGFKGMAKTENNWTKEKVLWF